MTDQERITLAEIKRKRKNSLRTPTEVPVTPRGPHNEAGTGAREELRRKMRNVAFNHFSASGARLRVKQKRKGQEPKTPKKGFIKRKYDPIDHVHPRHKREELRND